MHKNSLLRQYTAPVHIFSGMTIGTGWTTDVLLPGRLLSTLSALLVACSSLWRDETSFTELEYYEDYFSKMKHKEKEEEDNDNNFLKPG